MKIAIVCYPTFGGSGVVATELGLALSRRNHEIHFITYKQPVRLEQLSHNVHFHEVNVPEYPLFHYQPYELALSSKLVNVVKQHQIEILHVHYAIPHAYAGYMAKKMLAEEGIHIPMLTTLHGTDITLVGNHPFYKPAVTFSINHSDVVTCVSNSLRADTLRLFDVKRDIEVVPNFIDITKYNESSKACKRKMLAEPDQKIVTHISNFRKVKRIEDVIKIFHLIQKDINAKLIMVGQGPERSKAENLVEELGLESQVLFMGNSHQIDEILSFSDLFVLPSETESFGLAALEAMVNGVPVISTNTGGLPEVNRHAYSGFLSNVGEVEEMAANGIKILQDEKTLLQFKENAREQAALYDIYSVLPLYESLYEKAIQKK